MNAKITLLIFDYFTYFNKNIELNLPKRKKIQLVLYYLGRVVIVRVTDEDLAVRAAEANALHLKVMGVTTGVILSCKY